MATAISPVQRASAETGCLHCA